MRRKEWLDYLGITTGTLITALGLVLFLVPNKIAAGGVSGLATVLHYVFGWPVGLTMLALNIPLFLAGLKVLGWNFGLKTLYGTLMLSVFTDALTLWLHAPTANALLASIYGGLMSGVGLGVVFRSGGSTGGTDLAALLFGHFLHISSGVGLLLVDALVISLAGLTFNVELALYALLALILTSRAIDAIQEGSGYAKAAIIISDHAETIARQVMEQLDRGVTGLAGRGLYTRQEREVLLVVVQRSEVSRLKALVAAIDPRAFVIVSNIHEVLGEGFRQWRR
ncbi:putative 5xTM membrane BCR, YitT family [Neomoorella glycerini]|uniref:Putative 5xTM membrane BCR, YitT family n=1 Tax=Neomoorella glycerini TaxID=55779 RepID=A0A6I5ZR54_9FIRM|nr:YitT family protein [Moorella glycerini]QGP92206.1 putative 5xTM membrane BCR, YitT family [Moorella glycerini]